MTDKLDGTGMADTALYLSHTAYRLTGEPRKAFVCLMTAAAIAGHTMERTREEMHRILDEVHDVALAAMLHATEKKQ